MNPSIENQRQAQTNDKRLETIEIRHSNGGQTKSRLKSALLRTVLSVAFGTNFGIYNTSVANNLQPIVIKHINETTPASWLGPVAPSTANGLWSIVVSAFTAGSAIGTLCSPPVAEYLGRKRGLLLTSLLNMTGAVMCLFYLNLFELAIFGRMLMGFSLGMGIPLASAFITEISPVDRRGQLNALLQTAFGLGDLCGLLFTMSILMGTLSLSSFALAFTFVFSALQFFVLIISHDSPRFLILKQRRLIDGKLALQYYQGKEAAISTLDEIISENKIILDPNLVNIDAIHDNIEPTTWKTLRKHLTSKPLILSCLLLTTLGLSGIGTIIVFSTDAFTDNGVPLYAEGCTVGLGVSNLLGSFIAINLTETWGRKPLFICGLVGCFVLVSSYTAISLILFTFECSPYWSYALVVCLILFMLFFSLLGASCNTLAAEICPQAYRSLAVSLANFCLMFSTTVLILLYDLFKFHFGHSWVFLPSSVLSMLLGVYLVRAVPETRNRPLSEIKMHFQ